MSSIQPIAHSRLLIIDKRMTVRDVKLKIFKQFRHLIKTPDIPSLTSQRKKGMKPEKIVEEEYKWFFETPESQSASYEA